MGNIIEHKGYFGTIEPSVEDGVLYGKIMGINDLVTYEADNIKDPEKEFRVSVEDYLDFCKELGKNTRPKFPGMGNIHDICRIDHLTHAHIFKERPVQFLEGTPKGRKTVKGLLQYCEKYRVQKLQ